VLVGVTLVLKNDLEFAELDIADLKNVTRSLREFGKKIQKLKENQRESTHVEFYAILY
jgi:hypothetical protein